MLEVENPKLYNKAIEKFESNYMEDLISTLDEHIEELEDLDKNQLLELMTNIVGDA